VKIKLNQLPIWGFILAILSLPTSIGQQPLPETVDQLLQLPPEQRNQLQQKNVRFEQLTDEKKDEYREFNARLNAAPNQKRLRLVMQSYTDWLLDLDTIERERILALSLDQRLQEVVRLVQFEKEQRFKALLDTNLRHDDLIKVGQWYDRWLDAQRDTLAELSESIENPAFKKLIVQIDDPRQRSTLTVLSLLKEYGNSKWSDWFKDWDLDATKLIGSLSETAQLFYASAESDQQRLQLVLRWGYYSIVAQSMQGVSDDELWEFYKNQMSDENRELIVRQQSENAIPMLRQFYFQHRMPQVIKQMLAPTEKEAP
tara:strand:- start:52 stop:993 length:942 start_codon:yes stop_codon:yes gene_type:complete